MQSIGDLARSLVLQQQSIRLQERLDSLGNQATTGVTNDRTKKLGGATLSLSLIERKSALQERYQTNISTARMVGDAAQTALDSISDTLAKLQNALATVGQTDLSGSRSQLATEAEYAFHTILSRLNTQAAGRYIFSGNETKTAPISSISNMKQAVLSATATQTTAQNVQTTLGNWFDGPTGAYLTSHYQGSQSSDMAIPLSRESTAYFGIRADHSAIREALKAVSLVMAATNESSSLSPDQVEKTLTAARSALSSTIPSIEMERGSLGLVQSFIETSENHLDKETSALTEARSKMVSVDQYAAISEFRQTQTQWEIVNRVAGGRLASTLAEYLK